MTVAKQILVVDDSVAIRTLLRTDLGQRGFVVDDASGGRGALEKARHTVYDLVVTDLNMPGMDGLGLVRALRELDGYAKIPILVLTTETDEQMKAELRRAGATGWMSKPYAPERMSAALAKLLPAA